MEIPTLPVLNRVPGETKVKPKDHELAKDLTKLSRRELLDLKERQSKMLENKSWLQKLPDKGEKIQNLYDRAIAALEKKKEIDEAANLLKDLNLRTEEISNLEWEGTRVLKKEQLDSDDDEDSDPLAVLVSTNSITSSRKIVKIEPPQKPLITEKDLKEAEEIKNEHLQLDPVLEQVCQKEKLETEQRFLPYKNVKHREHPEPHKLRDNTSATPPVTKQITKTLTIRESIEVENENRKLTKELSEKHAAERLSLKMKELKAVGLDISSPPPLTPAAALSMTKYRLPCDETEELHEEDSDDSYESALSDDCDEQE